VADLAVMQFQDLLGLGIEARMNAPATTGANWQWRVLPGSFTRALAKRLYEEMRLYQRLSPRAKEKARAEREAKAAKEKAKKAAAKVEAKTEAAEKK